MVKINGEERNVAGAALADYLAGAGYDVRRVAVERNEEIVPRSQYARMILADGDRIEIVSFVGGG